MRERLLSKAEISVDVAEGRAMVAAARKHQRVVQVGTQRRSTPHLVEAIERVIKPGLLGTIGHAEVGTATTTCGPTTTRR